MYGVLLKLLRSDIYKTLIKSCLEKEYVKIRIYKNNEKYTEKIEKRFVLKLINKTVENIILPFIVTESLYLKIRDNIEVENNEYDEVEIRNLIKILQDIKTDSKCDKLNIRYMLILLDNSIKENSRVSFIR